MFWLLASILLVYTLSSCKSKSETLEGNDQTVLVQLHDLNTVDSLEDAFGQYQLKQDRLISRPMQIILFSFNSEKIQDTTLIRLLKTSELVKEAQQNRDVKLRN